MSKHIYLEVWMLVDVVRPSEFAFDGRRAKELLHFVQCYDSQEF